MAYYERGKSGRYIAKEIKREHIVGDCYLVTGKVLCRIEGARDAWDYIPILHERYSGKGKLTVREIGWYERNGIPLEWENPVKAISKAKK